MFEKFTLKRKIKDKRKKIEQLEQKRSRSQAALVAAILNHTEADDQDVDYFNHYTGLIDEERRQMKALQAKLDSI